MPIKLPDEERKAASKALAAVLAGAVVLSILACIDTGTDWKGRTFPGFLVHHQNDVGLLRRPSWPGTRAGLRAFDRIEAIDGVPVTSREQIYDHAAALPPDTPVRYAVRKMDGRFESMEIRTRAFTSGDLVLTFGVHVAQGILLTLIGFAVFWVRPGNTATWAFLLFCLLTGWMNVVFFDVETRDGLNRALFSLLNPMLPATLIHLGYTFPREPDFLRRVRHPVGYAYAFFAVLALLSYFPAQYSFSFWAVMQRIDRLATAVAGCFFLLAMLRTVRHIEAAEIDRRRALIVLMGACAGLAPPGLGFLLIGFRSSLVPSWLPVHWLLMTSNLFPLSVAYAIVRYNLFGVSTVLRRTVAYLVLTAFLVLSYAGTVLAIHALFEPAAESLPYLNSFLVVMFAFLFPPVRELTLRLVDKMFFRTPYDYQTVVANLSHALVAELDLDRILAEIDAALVETQLADRAFVLVRGKAGGPFVPHHVQREAGPDVDRGALDPEFELSPSSPLVRVLEERATELSWWEVRENPAFRWFRSEALEEMERMGAVLLVPALFKGEMVAILALGPKPSGALFNSEDMALVRTLADQASIGIHNARSYGTLTHLKEDLEEEVGRRTEEVRQSYDDLSRALADLQQTQTQLVQSKKLASLGELVAGIAHELNNPIGFLYANIDHIERYLTKVRSGEGDPEKNHAVLEELLEGCREGAHRAKSIVEDLRTFSRLDRQQLGTADVNVALETTLRILAHKLKGGIEVRTDYGELPPIECYPGQINQVFMNLLSNACDAVGDDGEIVIATRALAGRGPDGPPERVAVTIRDSGSGIEPELIERIFDPFFTTKDVGQGTGLGLAITHSIVERHGGVIQVHSEAGEGTTFELELPVRFRGPEAGAGEPGTAPADAAHAPASPSLPATGEAAS